MAIDVLMPVISAPGDDAVVTAWFVDDGQACTAGQLIAEVQAEKVSEEIEAPGAGFVVNRVAIGDPVPQGEAICRIAESADAVVATNDPRPIEAPSISAAPVRASPAAKRLARELGVDLADLRGTGPGGRVTENDVRAAGTDAAPMSSLRTVIARNLRRSRDETVPVTLTTTVSFGASVPSQITARVVKVAATVLERHPALNGTRSGDDFTPAATAHIGLAIQTDEGLVTPVIRDPARRSVDEIAQMVVELGDRARSKRLSAADYEGGTFTVSNLGAYRIESFNPVINLPQVAILGVGVAKRVPVVGETDELAVGVEMALSLTFDHAFVDGAPAAAFLDELRSNLEG